MANDKQQRTNNKGQTTNDKQQTTNDKQQTTNNKRQTTNDKQLERYNAWVLRKFNFSYFLSHFQPFFPVARGVARQPEDFKTNLCENFSTIISIHAKNQKDIMHRS